MIEKLHAKHVSLVCLWMYYLFYINLLKCILIIYFFIFFQESVSALYSPKIGIIEQYCFGTVLAGDQAWILWPKKQ